MSDPFDESLEGNIEPETRGPGRPRTREIREKGSVGRPRIRPIEDPSSRRRGRPTVDPSSIADQISTEAIISGRITAKAINSSVMSLQTVVQEFQRTVVNPLAKTVNSFSQSVSRFNNSHQVYLKEQAALAKDMHESFKIARKVGLDPIIRSAALSQNGLRRITSVMQEINAEKYQGRDYDQTISTMRSIDKKLNRFITTGTVGLEATESILREYYKTSKGTSKFLNAVTFATEDIAEDINSLKEDLYKYFRGKSSSKTVLQDQSESLKRIENNTKGLGFVVASSVLSGVAALVKTAATFSPYGTTDLFTNLFGKNKGFSQKSKEGMFGNIFEKLEQSTPVKKMKTKYQEADLGGYGPRIENIAETIETTRRRTKGAIQDLSKLGENVVKAWTESKVKRFAGWFWDVGKKMIQQTWERRGAIGVTIVDRVIKNYHKKDYRGPHTAPKTTFVNNEEALNAIKKINDKIDRSFNNNKRGILDDWESENYAQVAYSPEEIKNLKPINSLNKTNSIANTREVLNQFSESVNRIKEVFSKNIQQSVNSEDKKNNVIDVKEAFSKPSSNVIDFEMFKQKKQQAIGKSSGLEGRGPQQVTANPESNTKITSAEISSPRRAWASLLKLQMRIHGLLQRMFKHVKHVDDNTDELDDGLLDKLGQQSGGGFFGKGGIFGGLLAGLGATKLGKYLKAFKGGWKGQVLKGGLALGTKTLSGPAAAKAAQAMKAVKTGSTARVLWDTFGWGSAAVKKGGTGMQALANFKKTALGKSKLGRLIRLSRIASAGWGTGAESRILGGLIHATKWGGVADPLGASIGFFNAAKKRRGIAGFAKMANAGKVKPGLFNTIGANMDKAGASISGAATKAGNWLGGIGKVNNISKLGGIAAKGGGLLGGLKLVGAGLLKKIPVIGGLFTLGLGLKELVKDKDWKNGLWHIFTGILMSIPATALAGTLLSLGGDAVKFASNKLKDKNAKQIDPKKAGEVAVNKIKESGLAKESEEAVIREVKEEKPVKVAGFSPYGEKGPVKSSIGISNTEDHYKTNLTVNNNPSKNKPANAAKQPTKNGKDKNYGVAGQIVKAVTGNKESKPANSTPKGSVQNAPRAANQTSSGTPVTGSNAGKAENSKYINWNGQDHSHLLPEFSSKLANAAEKFYQKTGKKITITSGVRTNKKQAELYARRHGAGDTSISNNVARPVASTTVNWRGKQYWVKGKDNGQNIRTGHTVGGAVDVANWGEFKPYAVAEGLTWGGNFDPTDKMHFQVNTKAPVIGSASPVKEPPAGAIKVGDMNTNPGPSRETSPTIIPATSPTASNSSYNGSQNTNTEISPIIQDYGLAIINNLLFS